MTWTIIAPTLLAAAGAVCALAFDAFGMRRSASGAAVAGAVAAGAVPLALLPSSVSVAWVIPVLEAAVALITAVTLVGGWRRSTTSSSGPMSAALGGLVLSASLLVMITHDMVLLLVGLEAMGLAAYGLTALGGTAEAREATMKYVIQGAVATGLLIIGVSVLFVASGGSGGYAQVVTATGASPFPRSAIALAWALLACVLAFKCGAFPFHWWAPDVYEHSSPPAAALLASVPKIAVVVATAQLFVQRGLSSTMLTFATPVALIAALAAGSIVFGNLAALRQRSMRRMLAYSGIAQVGYALVGVVSRAPVAAMLCITLYGLAAAGAFLSVEAVGDGDPSWDGRIDTLAGLGSRRPRLAAAIAALMLSMTGIPLLAGFVGKLAVFSAAVDTGWTWLAVLGVVGSVVSFGYYGRVLGAAYLTGDGIAGSKVRSGAAEAATLLTAIAVVIAGMAPLFVGGLAALSLFAR